MTFLIKLISILLVSVIGISNAGLIKPSSYYKLTHVPIYCFAPPCPQYKIQAINTNQASQSILNINFPAGFDSTYLLNNESNTVVIYGKTSENGQYKNQCDLNVIRAYKSLPLGNSVKYTDKFYMFADNGIRCVKAPCPSTDAHLLNVHARFPITDIKQPYHQNVFQFDSNWLGSKQIRSDDTGLIAQGSIVGGVFIVSNSFVNLPDPSSKCPQLPMFKCQGGSTTGYSRDENRCLSDPKCTELGFCTLSIPVCPEGYNLVSFPSSEANGCPKYYCDAYFLTKTY